MPCERDLRIQFRPKYRLPAASLLVLLSETVTVHSDHQIKAKCRFLDLQSIWYMEQKLRFKALNILIHQIPHFPLWMGNTQIPSGCLLEGIFN